jgi:Ca2+-binding RTX toxin-like protein
MNICRFRGASQLGLTAAVAMAASIAAAGAASAAPPAGSSSVANDTLTIIGTPGADRLALRLAAGDANTLDVDFGDDGSADQTFNRTTFSRINVLLRSGDDQFRVDQVNGPFADEAVTVLAEGGDDTVLGGDGNDLVLGGSGNDTFDGNRGVDTALFGPGKDTFIWDPGDGSDALDGGAGSDSLVFNGANGNETMSLAANGSSSVFRRDPGAIRMDMTRVEVLDLVALGGVDTITVDDMSGTSFRQADIDLSSAQGAGDRQPDVVIVNGTDDDDHVDVGADGAAVDVSGAAVDTQIIGGETIDGLQINSLGGNDTVNIDDAVNALINVRVDLGSDQR